MSSLASDASSDVSIMLPVSPGSQGILSVGGSTVECVPWMVRNYNYWFVVVATCNRESTKSRIHLLCARGKLKDFLLPKSSE